MKSSFSTAPDIFKPLLKCIIFKCISWLKGSFLVGEHWGFLKEGVKIYQMAPMSPLNSPIFFVCTSIVYSLDLRLYRCADGRFLMSPRGMAVSNTRYLSSSETRVNAGIRARKLYLSESTRCQESVGGICSTNKWRSASLQPLTFSNHC